MSKIPQGEWNAIAARHARGETIARIAQDYGCTAPAIHYILKRQKERARPAVAEAGSNAATAPPPNPRPGPELRPAAEIRRVSEALEVRPVAELRPARADESNRNNMPAFTVMPAAGDRRAHDDPRPERSSDIRPVLHPKASHAIAQEIEGRAGQPSAARGSALKAGLDIELQSQTEEAIEAFRSHLRAALTDRSPAGRERLRAAASDLMRMAARTMIVLDRLSAGHDRNDRAQGRAPDYPRPAHAR